MTVFRTRDERRHFAGIEVRRLSAGIADKMSAVPYASWKPALPCQENSV
jgi:hypothetical protein